MHPANREEEETNWFANFIDKNAKPNACEYRPYSPTKIRKYVLDLFDSYEWRPPSEPGMWNDWIREADHRESTYNRFIALLNRIIKKAKDLSAAGENASAYIILRVLEDVATPNRFNNNGDLSPDEENEDAEELDLDMTPEEFFEELGTALDDVTEKLSDAETKYCEKRLKGYQEALPKEKYNKEAFKAFPLTVDGVKSMFDSQSFSRADNYVGRFFNIKSLIETNNKQKIYEIHSQIGAVSMSGEYYQTITFNNKKIIDSDCSCPVGDECKHLAALMLTICNKKKQRQA